MKNSAKVLVLLLFVVLILAGFLFATNLRALYTASILTNAPVGCSHGYSDDIKPGELSDLLGIPLVSFANLPIDIRVDPQVHPDETNYDPGIDCGLAITYVEQKNNVSKLLVKIHHQRYSNGSPTITANMKVCPADGLNTPNQLSGWTSPTKRGPVTCTDYTSSKDVGFASSCWGAIEGSGQTFDVILLSQYSSKDTEDFMCRILIKGPLPPTAEGK